MKKGNALFVLAALIGVSSCSPAGKSIKLTNGMTFNVKKENVYCDYGPTWGAQGGYVTCYAAGVIKMPSGNIRDVTLNELCEYDNNKKIILQNPAMRDVPCIAANNFGI